MTLIDNDLDTVAEITSIIIRIGTLVVIRVGLQGKRLSPFSFVTR